jgi:cell division protein FtsB
LRAAGGGRISRRTAVKNYLSGLWLLFGVALGAGAVRAQDSVEAQLRALLAQNERLQAQVQSQQQALTALTAQVQELRDGLPPSSAPPVAVRREKELRLTGEMGLAYFRTGRSGAFPKPEFRPDDAKIFVEAPVARDVYALGELDLTTREASDSYFELGELYVDFENVSGRLGGPARLLNVRAGRVYSPFGEEYLSRGPVANPLISHSLADVWGIDGGLEVYGATGAWQYALAVQNGGIDPLHDFNADKSVAARLGWDPATWLHLSASAMRTGELRVATATVPGDGLSSLWFGNGFFRSLGSDKTTSAFWASLWEFDAVTRWKGGRFAAATGGVRYADNDRAANNARTLHFGFAEATQALTENLFGAARYSWIESARGFPLVGWGNFGRFMFAAPPTTDLRRLSLGFGYRLGPPLVLKLEYAWESGRLANGTRRDQENFFGAEAALKF